jgi:hypothetical protein
VLRFSLVGPRQSRCCLLLSIARRGGVAGLTGGSQEPGGPGKGKLLRERFTDSSRPWPSPGAGVVGDREFLGAICSAGQCVGEQTRLKSRWTRPVNNRLRLPCLLDVLCAAQAQGGPRKRVQEEVGKVDLRNVKAKSLSILT